MCCKVFKIREYSQFGPIAVHTYLQFAKTHLSWLPDAVFSPFPAFLCKC
jgi:hypothetical protein